MKTSKGWLSARTHSHERLEKKGKVICFEDGSTDNIRVEERGDDIYHASDACCLYRRVAE